VSVTTALAEDLIKLVADPRQVNDGESVRRLHGDPYIGVEQASLPDVVVYPATRGEVSAIVAYAAQRSIAVTPYGAGTSAEGMTIPRQGGITLNLTGLDTIEVRPGSLQATVGAGVTRSALNRSAAEYGLQFPVDPGADATLGGMVATNASGTTAVRYGAMRQNVLELEVVLADGTPVRTGARTVKTSAGYNLTHLFVGSEGTLGVICAVTLRLYGIPDHVIAIRAPFPTLEAASACATALVAAGIAVQRVELLDAGTLAAMNAYKGLDVPLLPHLFIELAGAHDSAEAELVEAHEIARELGASGWETATAHAERQRLWEARHEVLFAMENAHPGRTCKGTDTCVPLGELPAAIAHSRQVMEGAGFPPYIIGHVGDGNYHAMFMVDTADPAEMARQKQAETEIVRDCLARHGTSTGETGVGISKMGHVATEHADLLPLMRGVKRLLDPSGILNPGKIFEP
jgi:D-lactate dehydrogenase (cytochrome)